MTAKLKCTFIPQVWVRDTAMEVNPEGEQSWIMTMLEVEELTGHAGTEDLDEDPFQRDELRFSREAPSWVKDWSGPFEVEWELLHASGQGA